VKSVDVGPASLTAVPIRTVEALVSIANDSFLTYIADRKMRGEVWLTEGFRVDFPLEIRMGHESKNVTFTVVVRDLRTSYAGTAEIVIGTLLMISMLFGL
jgi:hypothetical protein